MSYPHTSYFIYNLTLDEYATGELELHHEAVLELEMLQAKYPNYDFVIDREDF
jgi:hypothetical protein